MTKILVTEDLRSIRTPNGWDSHLRSSLSAAGFASEYWEPASVERAVGARGILVNSPRVGAAELDCLPDLEVLVRFGSGIDNIDVDECERRGVQVRNIPGPIATEMTAAITGLVMERLFEFRQKEKEFTARGWQAGRDVSALGAAGSTVGLVGSGRIATRVAEVMRHLGVRVCFASPSLPQGEGQFIGERLDLNELCGVADVIVVLSPLREDTRNLLGEEQISHMRSEAHLIAISRGGVVDEKAAIAALESGGIASLHLDVFEQEPTEPNSYIGVPGLTITSHNAAWSQAFFAETLRAAIKIFRATLT